jgi:hypothetical protein
VKRRVFTTIAALVVAFVVGSAVAYAQAQPVTADITFPFVAGGKEMAAGKYTFEVTPARAVVVRGLGGPGTSGVVLPIVTLLGRHDKDTDPEFVFDKINGKLLLSEVWMPGKDGLLVLATKGPHEHAVSGGSNPTK